MVIKLHAPGAMSGIYRNSFWENTFLSQVGFDTLTSHIKEGQKSCKWLEDYLKQRAKAEEDYAKTLLKIAKTSFTDFGTLRSTLDKLLVESETEASLHLTVAQKLQEQCLHLAEFREFQKEERKKNEDLVHRAHKAKVDQYKRMQSCKTNFESRYRASEKAESEAEKVRFGAKPKETEKAKLRAINSRTVCLKADEDYQASVNALEVTRENWERDHSSSCDELQRMEEDRIEMMRDQVWVFTNLISDLCCQLDDSRENLRQVAEKCSPSSDVADFANQSSTGKQPLAPIVYQAIGPNGFIVNSNPRNARGDQSLPSVPVAQSVPSVHVYEMGEESDTFYTAQFAYMPQNDDEIELREMDRIKFISFPETGWMKGLNLRSRKVGIIPISYVSK